MTNVLTKAQLKKWNTKPRTTVGVATAKRKWEKINIIQKKYFKDLDDIKRKTRNKTITITEAKQRAKKLYSIFKKRARRIV